LEAEDAKAMIAVTRRVRDEISKVIVGKEDLKEMLLVALLGGGHILIEGLTGTGKTLFARTFAKAIGGEFKRIQFTPDMLPADVTGFNVYTPDGRSIFTPGPVFSNVLLADELNRTTPRTQAALLEAMQESQVSIDGVTHRLPRPFMVLASQLPYGYEGTYPLTEVQVDRFMFRVWSGYPSKGEENDVLRRIDYIEEPDIEPIITPEEILRLQHVARKTYVSEKVIGYITGLVAHIRGNRDVSVGPSPRASIALYKGSRALAFLDGRGFVIPDDVKKLAPVAVEHRMRVKPEAEMDGVTPTALVAAALKEVPVPKLESDQMAE